MALIIKTQITIGRWTKFTFLGWLLGVILILILSSILDAVGIEHMQFYVGVGMGAGVGFTQWRTLKKQFGINQKWIWLTILGMGLPFILIDFILPETVSYKLPISVILGGIFTGSLQFSLLKTHFSKAGKWVLSSFIGWTLSALCVLIINYTMAVKVTSPYNLLLALLNLLLILTGGIVLGVVTGTTLKRIQA